MKNEWEVRKWTEVVWTTLSRIMARNKKKRKEIEGIWNQGRIKSALFVSTKDKHIPTL